MCKRPCPTPAARKFFCFWSRKVRHGYASTRARRLQSISCPIIGRSRLDTNTRILVLKGRSAKVVWCSVSFQISPPKGQNTYKLLGYRSFMVCHGHAHARPRCLRREACVVLSLLLSTTFETPQRIRGSIIDREWLGTDTRVPALKVRGARRIL